VVVRAVAPELETPVAPGVTERRVPIRVAGDAKVAAFETRRVAGGLGMPARAQWEAGVAAEELASNVLEYGGEGVLTLRVARGPISELVIEVSDFGLGLASNPGPRELEPFSSKSGLESVRRLMDELEIQSVPKRGTRLVARKRFLP
jgi:anti-sigma regulatory factor (Ser/Thr protein kinase)